MTIELRKMISPNNKIIKEFSEDVLVCEGHLREKSSVEDPTITLEGENLSGYNYMYIPDFGRYYFIRDITYMSKDIWVVLGHVDVLETYRDSAMKSRGLIIRRGNGWNAFIDDNLIPIECRAITTQHKFTGGDEDYLDEGQYMCFPGDGWCYFLITAGPGGTNPTPTPSNQS